MSKNNKIRLKIRTILSSILDISDRAIGEDFSITNSKSWDSLKHLNIIFSLEEVFGIQFTDNDMENMTSFLNIETAVQRKLKSHD